MEVREKLVELLMQVEDNMCDDCGREPVGCAVVAIADHLIANDVAVQGAADTNVGSKWISVKDRLPDGEELVMIHCKNGAMFVGYCGRQYCDYERRWRIKTALNSTKLLNLGRVTHWMPLPQPPKG